MKQAARPSMITVKSQLQAAPPKFGGQYAGKILVPIYKQHRYFMDGVRSVSVTSRIVIYQTLLL